MSKLNIILAFTVAVTVFIIEPHTAIAGPHDLVVIRPGGATASDEAQQNVNNLLKLIARASGCLQIANARYLITKMKACSTSRRQSRVRSRHAGFLS